MTEQRITTKEAERIAWNIERGRFVPDDLAAAIRSLAAERDALREALRDLVVSIDALYDANDPPTPRHVNRWVRLDAIRNARAKLGEEGS